jgi:hypothetical protein
LESKPDVPDSLLYPNGTNPNSAFRSTPCLAMAGAAAAAVLLPILL